METVKSKKILMISFLNANKTIGGMPNRFVMLWDHLHNTREMKNVYLLSTKSLWTKLFGAKREPDDVILFDDGIFWAKFSKYFLWLRIILICRAKDIDTIHIAGGGKLFLPIFLFSYVSKIKVAITFASNSLQMASYSNKRSELFWRLILRLCKNVDVLNPTHDIPSFGYKKFISPCSFPYILQRKNVEEFNFKGIERLPILVFNGSFSETKNPLLAIEGFKISLQQSNGMIPFPKLMMFGHGPLDDKVDTMIKSINLTYNEALVERLPYSQLNEILAKSVIFLSLQDYDNYPSQSLMEAMLFGNSIIATNFGDTNLLVKKELGNYLIEKDADQLADAINSALLSIRINKNNHDEVMHNHNITKFGDYFIYMHNNLK